jgi:hypothetical protein
MSDLSSRLGRSLVLAVFLTLGFMGAILFLAGMASMFKAAVLSIFGTAAIFWTCLGLTFTGMFWFVFSQVVDKEPIRKDYLPNNGAPDAADTSE